MMVLPNEEKQPVIMVKKCSRETLNADLNSINPKYADILQTYGYFFESIGAVKPLMDEQGKAIFVFDNWFGFLRILKAIDEYISSSY